LAIVFLVTVVGGTLVANRRLEAQGRAAEQVKNFLKDILSSPDPSRDGRDVRMVDLLQRAAGRARKELADQPLVRAEIELTLGATYFQLSRYSEGEPLLRSAVELYEKHLPTGDWRTAEARGTLGALLHWSGRSEEGFRELLAAIAALRRATPAQDLRLAAVLEDLGSAYVGAGRLADSIPVLRECLAVCDRLGSPADSQRVAAYGDLATALADEPARRDEYLHYLSEAIALNRRLPDGKVNLATGLSNLADELIWSERFGDAEVAAREALELRTSLFGSNSVETAFVHSRLASVFYAQTNLAAAREHVGYADGIERTNAPPTHRNRAFTLRILGMIELESGNLPAAESRLREAREVAVRAFGGESPSVAAIDGNLAELLARRGNFAEARVRAVSALPGLLRNAKIYPHNSKLRQRLARLEELSRPSAGEGRAVDALDRR
jgi:serine/threonine-protein kinase